MKKTQNYVFLILDFFGIFFSLLVAYSLVFDIILTFRESIYHSESQNLAILLLLVSVIIWILITTFSDMITRFHKINIRQLFSPIISTLFCLIILAVQREYYSLRFLLYYLLIWTLYALVLRILVKRILPKYKILFLSSNEDFYVELNRLNWVVVYRKELPLCFSEQWDLIITDVFSDYSNDELNNIVRLEMMGYSVISTHEAIEVISEKVSLAYLHGDVARRILHGETRYIYMKKILDSGTVILFSPVILVFLFIVGIIVLVENGWPIFFMQKRIGYKGKVFTIFKFRTMTVDSEKDGFVFAKENDVRITKVGQILRKYRLDEIPQFLNVLIGTMSIIGPRPEQETFVKTFEKEIPLYQFRHNVRPGITGWAQVSQGYVSGVDESVEKLRFDFYYVKHCSLFLDLKIVVKTVRTIFTGFGSR